jgi:transposase IS4-like protein
VAKDSGASRPESGRLTDHVALGVLSSVIHRDVIDDAIRETGKREERSGLLPAHVVVYYVLALNLFFAEDCEEVMRQLVNGLRFLGNWRGN